MHGSAPNRFAPALTPRSASTNGFGPTDSVDRWGGRPAGHQRHLVSGFSRGWQCRLGIVCALWMLSSWGPLLAAETLVPETANSAADVESTGGNRDGSGDAGVAEPDVPKFELDVLPILTANGCNMGACHGKARGQNGFALSLLGFDPDFDYHAIVSAGRGRRVFPAASQFSLLLRKGSGELPHGGGIRLPVDSRAYRTIDRWIEAGMPRTTPADPVFQRIEITPAPYPLRPEQTGQLTVTAYYSDGSTRDVTETSFYQSSESSILAVDDKGGFTAGDLPGEATIMVRYMGQIATWSSLIPRAGEIQPQRYTELAEANFIDALVWDKLQQLNILPSEPIDDAKFLRRAYLDVIGRLPSAPEVRDYLADTSDNKREMLIDRLLARPEYADFWANKWADLLRPNPYRVGIKATLSLDSWLREAFRENLPYDQFARQLITAKGSTWRNGAVTVFRDRRSPEEITTMFSQLFLGVRLECAKCHQHPFEVYSQRDFYSLSAYFAKVGYKGTGLSPPISGGEEIVTVASRGSVKHPLSGEVLEPTPLWGEAGEIAEGTDPRQVFVDWLAAPSNRRFAEAGANRIWGELMGVGIVDPVDDMRATNPPSNPALLAALGDEFRRLGFDQKALIKQIMMSSVYGLSSLPNETNTNDHRNFSRHYRRLSRAEVVADALVDVLGVADAFAGMPDQSRAMQLWTFRTDSDLLDTFGRPDPNQDPPCERLPEATMSQALHLMNATAIQAKLKSDQGLPATLAARQLAPAAIVEELYLRIYSRYPTAEEVAIIVPLLQSDERPPRAILEDITWSLINTPEFIYED